MKKTILAAAAAAAVAAFAFPASAAEVSVYGAIDTGLVYQNVDVDVAGRDDMSRTKMNSSITAPNRWGIRGSETIGNDLRVGFNLEGQFGSDDGSIVNKRLFQRMSQVWLSSNDYGTLVLGRSGALRSGMGTTGIFGPKTAAFSNSWGDYSVGSKYLMPGSFGGLDNAITYQSPVMNGVQLHLQYSSQMNQVSAKDGMEEFENSSDRNWGVGVTYTSGPLHIAAVLDSILYSNVEADYSDSLMFSAAAAYDFGNWKLFASGAWFDDMKGSSFLGHTGMDSIYGTVGGIDVASYKGYALQIGANVNAGPGVAKFNIGWMDAEADHIYVDGKNVYDTDRLGVTIGYVLPLSKRSNLYAGAGWTRDTSSIHKDANPTACEAMVGVVHLF